MGHEAEWVWSAVHDLAEYGWIHVFRASRAQAVADAARSMGIPTRVYPLATRGWYCVEEAWDEEARRHVARGVARDDPRHQREDDGPPHPGTDPRPSAPSPLGAAGGGAARHAGRDEAVV